MRARDRPRVGLGAEPEFRRSHSGARLSPCDVVLILAFGLMPLAGNAQDLPPRAIHIIVPSPPGAASDISARLIGQKLSESLRQPVVVENQAGASGAIGMSMLRRAAPDGATIGVVIALAQTIDRIQNKKASFDIVEDGNARVPRRFRRTKKGNRLTEGPGTAPPPLARIGAAMRASRVVFAGQKREIG